MEGQFRVNPKIVIDRAQKALNDRDVDAFAECFDPLYYGEQPLHPDRALRGREKIRTQWSAIFSHVPGFEAKILRYATEGDVVWTECHWTGTQADKKKLEMRGVIIFGVREDHIIWSRIYLEAVQAAGGGIEAIAT